MVPIYQTWATTTKDLPPATIIRRTTFLLWTFFSTMGRFLSAVLRTKSNDLPAVYKSDGWLPFSGDLDLCSMTNTSVKCEICYISANSAPRLTKTINLLLELLFVKPTLCSGVLVSSVVESLKSFTSIFMRAIINVHISTFMCEVHRRQELEWWYCELCTLENVKPMQFDIFREDLCKTLKIQVMVDQKISNTI